MRASALHGAGSTQHAHPSAFDDAPLHRPSPSHSAARRSGRYLLLKMLRPRGAYISPSSNLDVQLLEVRGWQGPAAFGTVAQPPAPPQRPLL